MARVRFCTCRSLKLYFVLRMYGAEKLRAYLRHHIALAQVRVCSVWDVGKGDDKGKAVLQAPAEEQVGAVAARGSAAAGKAPGL